MLVMNLEYFIVNQYENDYISTELSSQSQSLCHKKNPPKWILKSLMNFIIDTLHQIHLQKWNV